jgi:glutaredoxin
LTARAPDTVRVSVLTKDGCHLCADAVTSVARICADVGVGWREQDIGNDADLAATWAEYVPVIFVDGAVHDWFRVREDRLRAALRGAP